LRFSLLWLLLLSFVSAKTFTVANYNVQNLFDLKRSGHEYIDYIPYTKALWNQKHYQIKLQHISQVINDINPDIIALEEIESDQALRDLQSSLKQLKNHYPYRAITHRKKTTVNCAILSKFPISKISEIMVNPQDGIRAILDVSFDINHKKFRIFVNHWKSKRGPESKRIPYGKVLSRIVKSIKKDEDYIIVGDLNSNYNEFKTFKKSQRFNNTKGITAINHHLQTIEHQKMNSYKHVKNSHHRLHYNLWMELAYKNRWSYLFRGRNNSLDHIIIPRSLMDHRGIDYLPKSFQKFTPSYLIKKRKIFRWKYSKRGGTKHHIGKGYSDHLPIFAKFSY